ncbi:FMN-binding negative transcriptional regulator [Hydrogenovibrio sp. JE_KL2]|nr:FMN-binding negative transcriptional regulator [Hydrogenovibrio sp. JE_KL2]
MYRPEAFSENNLQAIYQLIQDNPFAMIVTTDQGQPFVSHLPLMFEPDDNGKGKIIGHMARANPQWQHLAEGQQALVVFQGPHAYVSPSWYEVPDEAVGPTWNYAVVHISGKTKLIEDQDALRDRLQQLTQTHEAAFAKPWQLNLDDRKRRNLLKMIVGFEMNIEDINAKFKLSQNRSQTDRKNVINQLSQSTNSLDIAVAELMKSND